MKKSISSINLKKKNSEGIQTNRVSLNQSQFVPKLEKKIITHSMDSEVFKQYMPNNNYTFNPNVENNYRFIT